MAYSLKQRLLLLTSVALLVAGSAMLFLHFSSAPPSVSDGAGESREHLSFSSETLQSTDYSSHFKAESIERYAFKYDGKGAFDLLVARFRDGDALKSAVLFPADTRQSRFSSEPTGMRHDIWQKAAEAISKHSPESAIFLSWWDDGQRIRFLTGRDAWLETPADKTFANPVWKALRPQFPTESDEQRQRLERMARWLTMDADQALAEIAETFGKDRPIYILVNNDLLLHLGELAGYGGKTLPLESQRFPAGDNIHGDIAQVKRWAFENGDGNYLVQKEAGYYRAWRLKQGEGKNTLLVRLLPFIDSLKELPKDVSLVYQSGWGGFLSVYELNLP